jgi:hypothetical protein
VRRGLLRPIAVVLTERRRLEVADQGSTDRIEVDDDHVSSVVGLRRGPAFHQIEVEAASPDADRLAERLRVSPEVPAHQVPDDAGAAHGHEDVVAIVDEDGNKLLRTVTQYSMKPIEEIGLLKMDFLGLRNLTVLDDALINISANRGETVVLEDVDHRAVEVRSSSLSPLPNGAPWDPRLTGDLAVVASPRNKV